MHMLYQCPGSDSVWGIPMSVVTVSDEELEAKIGEGWFDHPWKARDAYAAQEIGKSDEPVVAEPAVVAPVVAAVAQEEKRGPGRPPKAK